MGEKKTHKQNSHQNPGTIPWKFCLRVFFFMCFFSLSQKFAPPKKSFFFFTARLCMGGLNNLFEGSLEPFLRLPTSGHRFKNPSRPCDPKGSKRCFPNGIFQIPNLGLRQRTVFFRFLTSACDKGKRFQRDEECLKIPMFFKHFGAFCPCGSWPPSQHTTLKNTV